MSGVLEAPPPAPEPPPPAPVERKPNIVFAPQTVSLTTGAGPADYFGTAMNTAGGTFVGAGWDARVTFGTRSIMALEAGYIGSSNKFNGGGRVDSNGFDGTFRLQLPYRVQPYAFTGIGYNRMATASEGNVLMTQQLNQTDNQLSVPAGAGLTAYVTRHVILDLRGTYRLLPGNDITVFSDSALHQWMAQGRIGYAF
jgi:hypothetical protein